MTDLSKDSLWGSPTASRQVEGGNTNNDWWGRQHTTGASATARSGDGLDDWHRYDGDFALLPALAQDAHRCSLGWSRIEAARGDSCRAAFGRYACVLDGNRRVEPPRAVVHRHGARSRSLRTLTDLMQLSAS